MGLESILAIIAILVSIGIYYAGVRQGKHQERQRQEHDRELERERQRHERQLEQERREHELASKVADEFVVMVRNHFDGGPHAMARLGLETLGSDRLVRYAIREMQTRTNTDPWGGEGQYVEDLDLVAFFRFVHETRVDFFHTSIEAVAKQVREAGGVRINTA